jgi:alkylhydroperoxidase/carboxymuconolactone decarboxylase family protein YurZ
MKELPRPFQRFQERYPELEKLHADLSRALDGLGPLDARARRLIHLGIAIGQQSFGGVKSHARRALDEGFRPEELRQAALLAMTTAGFPSMIAALEWVEAVILERGESAP